VLIEQITNVSDGLGHALPNSRLGYETLAFQYLGRPEIIFGALAIVGVFATLKSWRPSSKTTLLALVVLVTMFVPIAINHFMAILSFRAMSITIPVLVILMAHTLAQFGRSERFIMVSIIILQSLCTTSAGAPLHLPLPEAAQFLIDHSDNDDVILIETWFDSYALSYYLDAEDENVDYVLSEVERRNDEIADVGVYLADRLDGVDGVWVIAFSNRDDIRPLLMEAGFINTGNSRVETDLNIPIELWRFDRQSDDAITNFEDVFTLHSAQTRIGEWELAVNLLWSALIQPEHDYTMSVFLLNNEGILVAQHDGYPFDNLAPTSTWTDGQLIFDSHLLNIDALPSGNYQLGVKIYRVADGSITVLPVSDCGANCDFVIVDTVELP